MTEKEYEFDIIDEKLVTALGEAPEMIIPNGVKEINEHAFYKANTLEKISIPDSVEIIYAYAFQNCENLKEAVIGKGIKTIKKKAFSTCKNLKTVTINAEENQVKIEAFAFPDNTSVSFNGKTSLKIKTSKSNMSVDNARKKFLIGTNKKGFTIKGFDKRVQEAIDPNPRPHKIGRFLPNVKNKEIVIPDMIDRIPVVSVAGSLIPDDAVVICNAELFKKLSLQQKTSTAIAYLKGNKKIRSDQTEPIHVFVKEHPDMLLDRINELDAGEIVEFLKLSSLSQQFISDLLQALNQDAEKTAVVLEYTNNKK